MEEIVLGGRGPARPRIDRASPEICKALEAHLRYGETHQLGGGAGLKGKAGGVSEDRPTTRYIWLTRGDGKVRLSRAANDGRVFAWDDPPPTGHPGEDYRCGCWAEPYVPAEPSVPGAQQFFNITLQDVSDEGPPWPARSGDPCVSSRSRGTMPCSWAGRVERWTVVVPQAGLEPARPCGQQILSLSRLPFRHWGQSH